MALLSLLAKLGLDATGFNLGLKTAARGVESFQASIAATMKSRLAAAFSAAAVFGAARSTVNLASHIKDLSEQYDITTTEVQRFSFALEQGGLKFEDLGGAMDRFGAMRKKAFDGDTEAIANLKEFGITLDDIENPLKNNLALIMKLVEAMKGMASTPQMRANFAEIFGKKSGRLITALKAGSAGPSPGEASPDEVALVEMFGDDVGAWWTGLKHNMIKAAHEALTWDIWGRGMSPYGLNLEGRVLDAKLKAMNEAKKVKEQRRKEEGGRAAAAPVLFGMNVWASFMNAVTLPAIAKAKEDAKLAKQKFILPADSLANVGGFVGGAGGRGGGPVDVLKQQLRTQQQMKEYLRDLAENKSTFG